MPGELHPIRSRLRRGTIEFLIIVTGILAALAVDEWRENRNEQEVLDEYLVDLASEVDHNLASLLIVRDSVLRRKIEGLQKVIRFCQVSSMEEADPDAFLAALARSADAASPWFVTHRFEALQNSGSLRLVRNPELAAWIASTYEAPDVLFGQVEGFRGNYRQLANQLIPARYQSRLNGLSGYVSDDAYAPEIADGQDAKQVLLDIFAQRDKLLGLARNEAAVATGQWYALTRIEAQMTGLLGELAALGYESESPFADEMRRERASGPQ